MSLNRSASLAVEHLDDRLVPSATTLNLTTRGAEVATDGFIARQVDAQPTGTGYINSFVRIQGAASGGGSEQGYNTTARPLQFDENKSPQFTRGITLDQVPIVFDKNGTAYREFLLDINQKSSSPLLSVDQVRVFLGGSSDLHNYDTANKTLNGQPAVFDLDANGDVTLKLDARLNSGSGAGDMTLLIPNSAFAGADPKSFVYLYSQMGATAGATANGGFEEWAVRKLPAAQPTPGTSSLSGSVFLDVNQNGVLEADQGDRALSGVTVQLQGVDDLGNNVVLTTTTDANGFYQFTGLRAGTYTILETQPADNTLMDGADYVGTVDGASDGALDEDRFFDIQLGPDQHGVNYIFTEQLGLVM
jgi:hypothetical protein